MVDDIVESSEDGAGAAVQFIERGHSKVQADRTIARCRASKKNPEGCRDDTGAVQGDEPAIQKRMPNIQKIPKTVGIIHVVIQGHVPNIAQN